MSCIILGTGESSQKKVYWFWVVEICYAVTGNFHVFQSLFHLEIWTNFALKINYLYCLELGVCDGKKQVSDCMEFICELNCRSQNMEAVYRSDDESLQERGKNWGKS